jgi:cation-transporting P-type ATPase C
MALIDEISVLPGRIRFRSSKVYTNKLFARYINSYIEGLYGVNYSSINPSTGSILIVYDVEKTNHKLLVESLESAIDLEDNSKKEEIQKYELYYKTIEKRDSVKGKFLFFGILYLLLKLKHSTLGKFSISRNIAVLEAASAVTIIGGYPLLKNMYKKYSNYVPTDADILLKLTAASFTILRESTKGVFVLILKYLSDYIKYSAEVECLRTLNSGMGKTTGMIWLVLDNNEEVLVPVDTLNIGDMVNIHKGEISPVCGKIVSGKAVVNSLYNVGQPIVTHVGIGNKINEGVAVVLGDIKLKVQSIPVSVTKKDLSLDKLNIHKKVGAYQNKITKIALGAAGLNYIFTGSMLNALSVLLVLTPSATATALSHGMKNYVASLKSHNIYLRNPNTFEKIINTNSVMFDKTGTLTYGNMRIINIESFSKDYSSHELLRICAACEVNNYHPISITLQDYVGEDYDVSKLKSSVLIPSQGIEAVYDNHKLLIGNKKLFQKKNINLANVISKYNHYEQQFYYPILIGIDREIVGIISMKDEIRKNVPLLIDKLKYRGINDISLLTGDIYEKSCNTGKTLGIDKVYAECSSDDKLSIIREAGKLGTVMMVGDGINDIDAMKAADVSISFANSACDKIKLHSDCIIFEENVDRLADLIYLSQVSHKLIRQSISFSQFYNITFGTLAFFQYFDAFTAKSLNTINSLIVLLLNERIRWIVPDKMFHYEVSHLQKK